MTESRPASGPSRTIRIPEDVARRLDERVHHSSFGSVDAFVTFVLARLLEQSHDEGFSEADEKALKERLRSLGYID